MSEAAKQERSLVRKLAEVKVAVDRIAKNGHNDHFNYDFATESDIAAAVRKEMGARSLMMFPNVKHTEWERVVRKNGGETKLCTLTVEFTVEDGDSGETRAFTVMGQGEDPMDKATYKALTGAEKYALLKLFMIPTGDDPEKSESEGLRHTPGNDKQPEPRKETANQPSGEEVRVPYGKSAGKLLSEVTEKDLSWLLTATTKSVNDPSKARFKESNQQFLSAVQREAQRRISVTGKVTAPPATSPRQVSLLVDGEEEIVTPSQRFFQLARESGLGAAALTSRAKGVLNKTAGWTHADIDALETSVRAVPG